MECGTSGEWCRVEDARKLLVAKQEEISELRARLNEQTATNVHLRHDHREEMRHAERYIATLTQQLGEAETECRDLKRELR